jgi:hypothetical protein
VKASFVAFCCLVFVSSVPLSASAQSDPPSLCKPCLFYAGDFDETDPNSTAFPDENTRTYAATGTYGAVKIPQNHGALVEGILFQIIFDGVVKLDPNEATWEIRTGISEGDGGTLLASGQGFVAIQPTGRGGNGPEYSVAVKVNPPISLSGGVYWFNLTPLCLNKRDPVCATDQYGVSNTTQRTNNFRGFIQPSGEIFVNSEQFFYKWENWCNLTGAQTCASLSFGLIGKILR